MLLSKMGYRGEVDGGETEARRTRGLDFRQREHLDVEMSAWRQGTTTARGLCSDWRCKGSGLQGTFAAWFSTTHTPRTDRSLASSPHLGHLRNF